MKSIVIDVERSLKGDRQGAPPELGFVCTYFFVMLEGRSKTIRSDDQEPALKLIGVHMYMWEYT